MLAKTNKVSERKKHQAILILGNHIEKAFNEIKALELDKSDELNLFVCYGAKLNGNKSGDFGFRRFGKTVELVNMLSAMMIDNFRKFTRNDYEAIFQQLLAIALQFQKSVIKNKNE